MPIKWTNSDSFLIIMLVLILFLIIFFGKRLLRKSYKSLYGDNAIPKYFYLPSQGHKYKKHTHHITLWYSLILTLLLYIFVYTINQLFNGGYNHIVKVEVFVGIFLTLFLGIWGALISFNILKSQRSQIVSMDDFLTEIIGELENFINDKSERGNFEIFIYDFHPFIGDTSGNHIKYKHYENLLTQKLKPILSEKKKLNIIAFHENSFISFYDKLAIDIENKIDANKKHFDAKKKKDNSYLNATHKVRNNLRHIEIIKSSDYCNGSSVWLSNNIDQIHFYIIGDVAFQYVVLPDIENHRNKIYGIRTDDAFVINYLKETFETYKSQLIKPTKIEYHNGYFYIYFLGQYSIDRIKIKALTNNKVFSCTYDNNSLIKDRNNDKYIIGFKLKDANYLFNGFRYSLMKKNGEESGFSNPISYINLVKQKKSLKEVKYVLPFKDEHNDSLENLMNEIPQSILDRVINMVVFYNSKNISYTNLNTAIIKKKFNFPTCLIAQKPNIYKYAIELTLIGASEIEIKPIKYKDKYNCSILKFPDGRKEIYISDINNYDSNLKKKKELQKYIEEVLDDVNSILIENEFSFNDIVRQWAYIGNILDTTREDDKEYQFYQIFNEIRAKMYDKFNLSSSFLPASTGIGLNKTGFCFECCAVSSEKNQHKSINNSLQKHPTDYDQSELKNDPIIEMSNKKTPLFERGKILYLNNNKILLYLSGTAAVRDDKVVNSGDTAEQIEITLENIRILLSENDLNFSIRNFSYLRIYYKNEEDYDLISSYLNPLIKDIPHVFLKADICKEGLRIEIEGAIY